MSLQLWMPLTKDLRQQGLSGITPTQTTGYTSVAAGKLGGCYKFTDVFDTLLPLSSWDWTTGSISFGCWAKISKSELTTLVNAATYDSTSNSMGGTLLGRDSYGGLGLRWKTNNIYSSSTLSAVYIYVHMRNTNSSSNNTNNYSIPFDTWFHVMVVIDRNENKIKVYINGELFSNTNLTVTGTFYTGTFRIAEATWDSSNGIRSSGCWQLNDIRVYNHALSQMEVKELAKGLVLHYPLDRQGWGQENLIKNSSFSENLNNWFFNTNTGTIVDGYNGKGLQVNITSTTTVTPRQDTLLEIPANTTITCQVKVKVISGSWDSAIGRFASILSLPKISVKQLNNDWKLYIYQVTTTQAYTMTSSNVYGFYNMSTGTYIIDDIKLEYGDIVTPWCPNLSDTLATTMGLNSTIEYDCSGFCNNGTRTGTFTWTSDTPKYAVSQVFNGTDNAIQTPNLLTMITDKNYTIACWTYKTVIGTKNYQTIYGGPSGFELEARSSSSTSPLYRIHNWGGGTTAYNFGEWTHFCFVHTDSDSKLYVNGELKITGTSVNIPNGNYFIGAWNTATQQNFEGNMSDFRIYATALSADDVKSLYQNSAYIDSSGNVYGAVHSEV